MALSLEEEIQLKINKEYEFYSREVKPLVDLIEVYFGAIPDAVLNEARNFIGHIASAATETTKAPVLRLQDIEAAHTHLRRILLDCYKLMCIHQQDYIKKFKKEFKYFNISDVDDGNFLINLRKYSNDADEAFKVAKRADNTGKNPRTPEELGEVYEKYCIAYNTYTNAVDYINDHFDGVLRVAHKHFFGKVISVLGWLIGIVLAILSLSN